MQSSPRIEELRQKFHENPRRYFAPLANEYRKAGDSQQAIAICRAHLAQQPRHMSGHVVYGQALYDAGRTEEARVVFEQALALDPENVIVLRHLGDIARRSGDVQVARDWYSRALDLDPQDSEIAAYVAELTEPLTSGTEEAELPVTSENKPPIITRTLAELYLQQGHLDSALEIYRQLAVREPDDPSIRGRIDELVRDLEIEHPASVEMPSAITPEPVVASSQDTGQEETEDAAQEPIEPDIVSVEQRPAVEEPAEREIAVENEPVEHEDTAAPTPPAAEPEAQEAVSAEAESLVRSDEKHFSEADLSSEPWDADDFWGTEAFAEAGETDQIFGLPYDSEIETEKLPTSDERGAEHEAEETFPEAGASTASREEAVESGPASEGAIGEAAFTAEMTAAEQKAESAVAPEEAIVASATDGEITTAAQKVEFAAATEPAVSGSATAEWMSVASSVVFEEVASEGPQDAASVSPNPEVEAQTGPAEQASDAQTDAEPQADGDAEPQLETEAEGEPNAPAPESEGAPIAPTLESDTVAESLAETVTESPPETVPETVPEAASQAEPDEAATANVHQLETVNATGAAEEESDPVLEPAPPATQAAEPLVLEHEASAIAETPVWAARITVREFFATLGSARAPSDGSREESARSESAQPEAAQSEAPQSEAAHPESPQPEAEQPAGEASAPPEPEQQAEVPFSAADDAFSSLFADYPVSPEDNRAAAALSGAVSHEPASPSVDASSDRLPSREPVSPAGRNEPPQESEEDLRRFREWLDGLTES